MNDERESSTRERIVRWENPMPVVEAARHMSGIEVLRAIRDGKLPSPPIANLLGMNIVKVEEESIIFTLEPAEYLYNPLGTVHGGALSTVLDSAMGCIVQANLSAGMAYTTLELKVNFLRAVTDRVGTLFAEGTIIHKGKRTMLAEARIKDEAGKLYAHATSTCIVLQG
jgi:uncharacterized protein (TIGR00369 family)